MKETIVTISIPLILLMIMNIMNLSIVVTWPDGAIVIYLYFVLKDVIANWVLLLRGIKKTNKTKLNVNKRKNQSPWLDVAASEKNLFFKYASITCIVVIYRNKWYLSCAIHWIAGIYNCWWSTEIEIETE